jgi:hypothetical protein
MPIATRTGKATHRLTLVYVPEFGERKDGGQKFVSAAIKYMNDEDIQGRLIIDFGVSGNVSSIVLEQTVPARDIKFE